MISVHKRAAVALAIVAGLTLTGCSPAAPADEPVESASPSEAPVKEDSEASDDAVPGDLAAPGSEVKLGEWASYNYVGTDDQSAVIAARLSSIDEATQAQTDYLVGEIPQLAGYTVWLLTVDQKKVSGDSILFSADYTGFYPASADGQKVQAVTVIGWDDCKTESFSPEFDEEGATIQQCYVAATVDGGVEVAGVIYAQYDSAYAYYDGKPLKLFK